jgi:hypothetical protein
VTADLLANAERPPSDRPLVQVDDLDRSAMQWRDLRVAGLEEQFATDPSMFRRSHIASMLDRSVDPTVLCEHVGHTPPALYPRTYVTDSPRRLLPLAGMTATETRAREWLDTPEFGAWLFGRHSWCAYYRATKERTVPKKVEGLWDLFWYVDQSHDPYDVTVYEMDQMIRPLVTPAECDRMDAYYSNLEEGDDEASESDPLAVVEHDEADDAFWTEAMRIEFWQWYSARARRIQTAYLAARRGWFAMCAAQEKLPALVNRLPVGNGGRPHGARCQIATTG